MDFWSLETAKNVATNGRLFCVMLFAVSLVAFASGYGNWYARHAILFAVIVGLSIISDQLPVGVPRAFLEMAIYLFAAFLAVTLFLAFW